MCRTCGTTRNTTSPKTELFRFTKMPGEFAGHFCERWNYFLAFLGVPSFSRYLSGSVWSFLSQPLQHR